MRSHSGRGLGRRGERGEGWVSASQHDAHLDTNRSSGAASLAASWRSRWVPVLKVRHEDHFSFHPWTVVDTVLDAVAIAPAGAPPLGRLKTSASGLQEPEQLLKTCR